MKLATVIVLTVTLFVVAEGFGENFGQMAMLNSMSGRRPFDFSSMFGGQSAGAMGNTGGSGMGMGNMGMMFLLGGGDVFGM